jgi:hypothetical protein
LKRPSELFQNKQQTDWKRTPAARVLSLSNQIAKTFLKNLACEKGAKGLKASEYRDDKTIAGGGEGARDPGRDHRS